MVAAGIKVGGSNDAGDKKKTSYNKKKGGRKNPEEIKAEEERILAEAAERAKAEAERKLAEAKAQADKEAAEAAAAEAEKEESDLDDWENAAAESEDDVKESWDADSEEEREKAEAKKAANGKLNSKSLPSASKPAEDSESGSDEVCDCISSLTTLEGAKRIGTCLCANPRRRDVPYACQTWGDNYC